MSKDKYKVGQVSFPIAAISDSIRMLRAFQTSFSFTSYCKRMFHCTDSITIKRNKLPPRPKWTFDLENETIEKFLHGGKGPGGQKINKCNSKVQLRHVPSGIVVECQETRSREQNRNKARAKLAHKVAVWNNMDKPLERDLQLVQLARQSKRSKVRRSREKYKISHLKELESRVCQQKEDEALIRNILQNNSKVHDK